MHFSKIVFCIAASAVNAFLPPNSAFKSGSVTLFMGRQPIIAGNWKLNPSTLAEAEGLARGFSSLLDNDTCPISADDESCTEVVVFPPFPFLAPVNAILEDAGVPIGAQSVFFEDNGAFTGAVSASMLKSIGVKYVLCGHSERRTLFKDDDNKVNKKVKKVLDTGMRPILCIGESEAEEQMDCTEQVCALQLAKDLQGITSMEMRSVVIAYEPVWAIGTGKVCAPEKAQKVHAFVRGFLAKMFDQETADTVRIQYGGSVTPDSVDTLMSMPDIDGCLVGGASLVAEKFARIANFK